MQILEWQSCTSCVISNNGSTALTALTALQCYGHQSCMNSSISVTGSADIECYGAYSCSESQVQQDGDGDIKCFGFHGYSYSILSRLTGSFEKTMLNQWILLFAYIVMTVLKKLVRSMVKNKSPNVNNRYVSNSSVQFIYDSFYYNKRFVKIIFCNDNVIYHQVASYAIMARDDA